MSCKKSGFVIFIVLLLALVMVFFSFDLLSLTVHECIGENCLLCFSVSLREKILETLTLFGIALCGLFTAVSWLRLTISAQSGASERVSTPVQLKVKLSD